MADNKPKEANMVETASFLFLAAVLIGVVLPAMGQVSEMAAQRQYLEGCRGNLEKLHYAMDQYAEKKDGLYPKYLYELANARLMDELPKCPAAKKTTYEDKGYRVRQGNPGRYTIFCYGNFHGDVGMGLNEPYYDSVYGLRPAVKKEE